MWQSWKRLKRKGWWCNDGRRGLKGVRTRIFGYQKGRSEGEAFCV